WARRILSAKNTLHEADARQVEEAFEAKLTAINGQSNSASGSDGHDEPQAQPINGEVAPATSAATSHAVEAIDKSELAHPQPRRVRDKDHLRFVSTQPCLICGRTPADPHHLVLTFEHFGTCFSVFAILTSLNGFAVALTKNKSTQSSHTN